MLTLSRSIKFAVNGFAGLAVAGFGLALIAPAVFHVMYIVVLSGSMTPAMPVGSLAVVRTTDPAEVLIGDAITFSSASNAEVLITHRVVEVLGGENGSPRFRTKGDANEEADAYLVPAKRVKGVVLATLPYLGYANLNEAPTFFRTRNGFLLITILPVVLLLANEVRSYSRSIDPRRRALTRRRQRRAS